MHAPARGHRLRDTHRSVARSAEEVAGHHLLERKKDGAVFLVPERSRRRLGRMHVSELTLTSLAKPCHSRDSERAMKRARREAEPPRFPGAPRWLRRG